MLACVLAAGTPAGAKAAELETPKEDVFTAVEEVPSEKEEGPGEEWPEAEICLEDVEQEALADGEPEKDDQIGLSLEAVFSSGAETKEETQAVKGAPNTWSWDPAKRVFVYWDFQGQEVPVSQLAAQEQANGSYTGYYHIGGKYYCLDDSGAPRTGEISLTVNGVLGSYYFSETLDSSGIPGEMAIGWRRKETDQGDRWLYYETGEENPQAIGRLKKHGVMAVKLDPALMGDDTYLIDGQGFLLKNTMKKAENGRYYMGDKEGRIYKNKLVTYKGKKYYMGKSGARATWKNTWHRCKGDHNRLYYFGPVPGRVEKKTGWQKVSINGKFYGWFYFSKSGKSFQDKLMKSGYYLKKNGKLAGGTTKINGKMYYFTPSTPEKREGRMVKDSFITRGKSTFYARSNGRLVKSGWKKIDGSYYCFQNYRVVKNSFRKLRGVNGYLDSSGKYTTGWVIENDGANKIKYIDPEGDGFAKDTKKVIDGLTYYFDKDGYRINDVSDKVKGPYSVVADRINGVLTIYNGDKTIPVKSVRISVGAPGTPTPLGNYRLTATGTKWVALMGPSWGQYGTHVVNGIFIHSVSGSRPDSYAVPSLQYNRLGNPASHGCIRVCVADAKWIFENCNGASISIIDGKYRSEEVFKGPLGRPALVPMRPPYNADPTDPDVR